jgi:hypothetical protein
VAAGTIGLLCLIGAISSSLGASPACACEGGGGGGGTLVALTSPLNFGERATGGKYELTEEWAAIGENVATGGVLYSGSAEFDNSASCVSKLIVVGKPCKEKVTFEPLAKTSYSGEIIVHYETEIGHVIGKATVHVEGKGK